MGKNTGVEIDLALAPLKYPGLSPWEILLSESQERMAVAVEPENIEAFLAECKRYNVKASTLGTFTDSQKFVVKYGKKWNAKNQRIGDEDNIVAEIDYDFLENGIPQRLIKAKWEKKEVEEDTPDFPSDWVGAVKKVLAHYDVCSKKPIVSQYDYGVQGTNVIAPYDGVSQEGPNDAVVLAPIPGQKYGMVISHGMNPHMMEIDPYKGSLWAIAEAMANYVAVGGDPKNCAWINNYIWPAIHEGTMGSLDLAVDAVCDAMNAYGIPVVSGKDSLSSTYRGEKGEIIEIPPVLCMSVFGGIDDIAKTITSDFKSANSSLYLIGEVSQHMGGTAYFDTLGLRGNEIPVVDLESQVRVIERMNQAIGTGKVLACHDISEGGLVTAVAEMCFGSNLGAQLELDTEGMRVDRMLFSETAGTFVAEIREQDAQELFTGVAFMKIGRTTQDRVLAANVGSKELFNLGLDDLKSAWQQPMERYFT